ncbi:M15 family metallopeptidase [Streptomyces sp. NPDC057682]|uniref:M15 family metallopeptidase n=1 Tax=Streptomyces sp. NPDC057682 TaxID=3346210 RepID=UPI003687E18C
MTSHRVLMADPAVAAIPVRECGEPLVDVRTGGRLAVDDRKADPAGAWAHVRSSVLARLQEAEAVLPDGIHLLLVEGYRPPSLQAQYFERYEGEQARLHPDWAAAEVRRAASRFVSPPEIAPHSAGGAVDVTLIDRHGQELDLGTRVNASPEESDQACYTDATNISATARAHRTLLGNALTAAGFRNYWTEYWHWEFNTRLWALLTGRPAALYGPVVLT